MNFDRSRRRGFTLMEIMVVIIVIAVLSSVAGPMIGTITDQGRASATKSKMASLKSAIVSYNGHCGRYPFAGNTANAGVAVAYNAAWTSVGDEDDYFSNFPENNVLMSNAAHAAQMLITNYNRRWKGPYMDSDPQDFMFDAWGERIQYFHFNKGIWLRSGGPNMDYETNTSLVTSSGYIGDDVVLSVGKVRF